MQFPCQQAQLRLQSMPDNQLSHHAMQGKKEENSEDPTDKMQREQDRQVARDIARRVCVADLLEFRRLTEQLTQLRAWLQA